MKKLVTLFVLVLATSVAFGQVADLFFSEYIEGSSNNKALEIYNGTGAEVDLSDYIVRINYNGNPWSEVFTFPVGTTIANGDVYVIAHGGASADITGQADTLVQDPYAGGTSYMAVFNGDDVRALCKISGTDTTIIDIIGLYDLADPGDGWAVAGVVNATKDHTLIRKATVTSGNSDWTASAGTNADDSEWIVLDKDTFNYLGLPLERSFVSVTFTVTDSTLSYEKIMVKGSMTNWDTVQCYDDGITGGDILANDHIWTTTVANIDTGTYEWGAIEDDGSEWGIWLIDGDNRVFTVAEDGTVTGETSYVIPPPGEHEFLVTFILNTSKMDNITDSTVVSTMVSGSYDGWKHDDTLAINGDYCSITIPILGHPTTGVDFAFKHWYIDAVGTQNWESVQDRNVTVTSDTTFLTYWNNEAPFVPTDSIDVWFRVNMAGVPDYDGTSPVGVRGSIPLDPGWEHAEELTKEGDTDYYSGLISFPNDDIGDTIQYKFVWGPLAGWDNVHWEAPKDDTFNGNRYFYLGSDTTLAFKYFSDEPPTGVEPQTAAVVFSVDMSAYLELGLFSEARKDSMQVRGGFNSWNDGDPLKCKMTKLQGTSIYTLIAQITDFPGKIIEYKYYMKMSQESIDYWKAQGISDIVGDWGYEVPPTRGGGNRLLNFEGDPANYQILEVEAYNGLPLQGIIPEGSTVPVTFNIDMNNAPGFNSATDSVMFNFKDEWQVNALGLRNSVLKYDDSDGDGIYTITIDYVGPVAYTLIYTVSFAGPEGSIEEGGGFEFGRFRCRYIQPTTLDPVTWPAAYTCPKDVFTEDPPLDVENPPLGVVKIDDEVVVPKKFALEQNFPNPFNPTTEIRFSIQNSDNVTLNVYNMLGQMVTKAVYNNLQVGQYTYMWNGTDMHGNAVASGVYFYELQVGNQFRDIKKMVLMK